MTSAVERGRKGGLLIPTDTRTQKKSIYFATNARFSSLTMLGEFVILFFLLELYSPSNRTKHPMKTTTKVLMTSLAAAVACTVTAYAKDNSDKNPVDADKKKAKKEKN